MKDVLKRLDGQRKTMVKDLAELVAVPSISPGGKHQRDIDRSAKVTCAQMKRAGLKNVSVLRTSNSNPFAYGEWTGAPGKPTLLLYAHHDVQPENDPVDWDSPPFEPTERDSAQGPRLYARGAADDKGQVFFHLLGLDAHLAATGRTSPAVNLKLVVEGEEESGSPHFAELLRAHRDELACDVVVVSDTGMWSRDAPTVCVGMRGMTDCQVDLRGPSGDVHSGSFGGAIPNPLTELARLLGRRTGELHLALADAPDDPAFAPETFTPFARRSFYQSLRNTGVRGFDLLRAQEARLDESAREDAARVLALNP